MRIAFILGAVALTVFAAEDFQWNLPKGFPVPVVPSDNPMSAAKAELGRYLFYDVRMSVDGKHSCASCHRQELAFTDGRAVGIGATGERHTRGSMSLVNVAYVKSLTWIDQGLTTLEAQALVPMFGTHPVELGLKEDGGFLAAFRKDARYTGMFGAAFPGDVQPVTAGNIVKAIATFERTIISGRSPYDRYHYLREDDAVSASAKRGEIVFFSSGISCFRCHGGFDFSDGEFHNTGIGDGKFRTPTLRNVAITAPYMHDGSLPTLEAVIDHYSAGGRTDSPEKDRLIHGFSITDTQKTDLIEFLKSLTDTEVLKDPRFADPWANAARN